MAINIILEVRESISLCDEQYLHNDTKNVVL